MHNNVFLYWLLFTDYWLIWTKNTQASFTMPNCTCTLDFVVSEQSRAKNNVIADLFTHPHTQLAHFTPRDLSFHWGKSSHVSSLSTSPTVSCTLTQLVWCQKQHPMHPIYHFGNLQRFPSRPLRQQTNLKTGHQNSCVWDLKTIQHTVLPQGMLHGRTVVGTQGRPTAAYTCTLHIGLFWLPDPRWRLFLQLQLSITYIRTAHITTHSFLFTSLHKHIIREHLCINTLKST